MISVLGLGNLADEALNNQVLDLLEHCDGMIGIYDENEFLRYSNAAFRAAYAIAPGERIDWSTMMRRNFQAKRGTIIETNDIDAWLSSVRSRRGKNPHRCFESDLHDGRWIWVVETMQDNGWIVYFGTDVSPLNQSERHLRHARDSALRESQTDSLTGISNRKHVMGHLEKMAASALDRDRPTGFACLMDLDHFKAINDTRGHIVGDQVLTAFARCVRQSVRLRDGFGRVGGEEFLLLLPDVTLEDARRIVGHVFAAINGRLLVEDQPDLKVTFSAGLCPIDPPGNVAAIYARADQALYRAKMAGRNCLMVDRAAGSAAED